MAVQLAFVLERRKIPLPQHLIGGDRHGIRQIQTARFVDHGDAQGRFGELHQHMLGQSARLFSKEQKRVVGKRDATVNVRALGGKEEEAAALVLLKKVV